MSVRLINKLLAFNCNLLNHSIFNRNLIVWSCFRNFKVRFKKDVSNKFFKILIYVKLA